VPDDVGTVFAKNDSSFRLTSRLLNRMHCSLPITCLGGYRCGKEKDKR